MGFHVWVWIGLFRPHRSGTLNYKMTNAFCLFVATHLAKETSHNPIVWESLVVLSMWVTLHISIGWRKDKTCLFVSTKWFWPSIIAHLLEDGDGTAKLCTYVINIIWLLIPVSDWSIIMISLGDLLLLVSHLLAMLVSIWWVGL